MNPLPPPWPILLIVLPLVAAILAFAAPRRGRLFALAGMAGVTAMLAALTYGMQGQEQLLYPLGGWPAELGIGLAADGLSLWLLWLTALVNIVVGLYSPHYFTDVNPPSATGRATTPQTSSANRRLRYFYPLWLLLWASLNGLLLSADLFNIYVGLELLGLAAVCLVSLSGTAAARQAALRYLLLNIFGSFCFLLGVVLIYRQTGSLNLALFAELADPDPLIRLALAFMTLGMIVKSALFPLHFWLPPAHANAPAPASALLSALVVKASLYLVLKIWLPLWQHADLELYAAFQLLGGLGAAAIFWGSVQALRSHALKELIAYSTVAQMGYLFLAFPLLLGPNPHAALYGLLFILAGHALAKTAFFLAAGIVQQYTTPPPRLAPGECPSKARTAEVTGQKDRLPRALLVTDLRALSQHLPLTAITISLAAVILMGLPPSGGFIGKWYLLLATLDSGQWWWTLTIVGGTLLSVAYLLPPITATFMRPARHRQTAVVTGQPITVMAAPLVMQWAPLLLALAGILLGLFPWLSLELTGGGLPAGWQAPAVSVAGGGQP
ncbi:complex I subunit 5 family protein [Desulfurivibrio alkaliphilus]|uniref:NADH/Ubiquinone/plastoquinone (Complex I) n=1 Tax=Desulfurivibrio alkaliphilus (strain DSM 19089 / UNIQEM U267 / AHT2) TaxID=589865 RepID=D6Z735_DESAT|nr:proton-conducting transporter membrane subunit [Desulfurivibrio alkaliphilus]ADH87022.1 NADH/Ubiquinone/plastoquinone (complex I) [Desulfurivibrio alkaliphilus AHT 2]